MTSIAPASNSDSTALATRDDNQVSQPSGVAEAAPQKNVRLAELKWAEMQSAFLADLKEQGKGSQEKNFKTTFKFFLEAIGKTENSLVGEELTVEFEAKVKVFVKFQKDRNLDEDTYGPRVSKMRAVKKFVEMNFSSRLTIQTLTETFGQKLLKLILALGLTIMGFWRTLPEGTIKYNALRRWCRDEDLPSIKYLGVIEILENKLRVPPGTLLTRRQRRQSHALKIGQTDAGSKARAAQLKPYSVWTESLEEELGRLIPYKILKILPDGEKRSERGQWTRSADGKIHTARMVKKSLRSFMGYCALPQESPDPYLKGAGIKLKDLSFALLADKSLIEGYLEFKRLRSGLRVRSLDEVKAASLLPHQISKNGLWEFYDVGGKYNRGAMTFLAYISCLLHSDTGYLYQHAEYAEKLHARMTEAGWEQQCEAARCRAVTIQKTLSKMKREHDADFEEEDESEDGSPDQNTDQEYGFGRDPKEAIQWILDLPRPLRALQEMLKAIIEDLIPEGISRQERARQYRDIVLVSLLSANPLRITMFSLMKFDKNLIRESDGSWWLKFNKRAFKNRKSLKTGYHVRVATELWPMLDLYKEEFHPVLVGSTGSKYVFGGLRADSLSKIVYRLMGMYSPEGIGFGPHAFRHIIATDIIKEDRRYGYILASIALHDKYETVKEEYVHLKTSELFEPVNTHFSECWVSVFGPSFRGVQQ
jgi:integrase